MDGWPMGMARPTHPPVTMITPQILYTILHDVAIIVMMLFTFLPLITLIITLFSGIYPGDFIVFVVFRLMPAHYLIQFFTSWVSTVVSSHIHNGYINDRKTLPFATCDLVLILYLYWHLGHFYLRVFHPSQLRSN